MIRAESIERNKSKVEAILRASEPNNLMEIKAFTGMVNYCTKFILNLSTMLVPFMVY